MSHDTDIRRRDLLAAAGALAGMAGLGWAESLSAAEKSVASATRKFHHIGLPTDKKRENERYLAESKVYITDPAADPFRGRTWRSKWKTARRRSPSTNLPRCSPSRSCPSRASRSASSNTKDF